MDDLSKCTVLVVDDTEANRYALGRILTNAGFKICEAENGRQALELATVQQPHAVVLDVKLPDISGFEVCRRLKSDPRTANIPVLQVSASFVRAEDQARGLEEGADAYLTQPVERPVLVATIKALLRARLYEQELRKSRDRLQSVLSTITDAYCAFDREWRFLEVNAAAERDIFRKPAAELIGKVVWEVFPQANRAVFLTRYEKAAREGVPVHFEGYSTIASKWLEVHAYPREDRLEVYHRDISERKHAEEALAAKARELARSNAEYEQFASVISHDMRSPLLTISGCAQLLREELKDRLGEEELDYLKTIQDNVNYLGEMIRSLLSYARLGSSGIQVKECDLRAVVHGLLVHIQSMVDEAGATITCDPLPTVRGDEVMLTRLFQNLIENGIKYRRDQPPRIHVGARRDNAEWVFSVSDNGIGIEPRHFDRVFQMFQRLHGDESQYKGSGVGLATCKKIVERHGGRIWLESVPGEGTTFHFALPA